MIDLALVELPNLALESPKMYFALGNLYLAAAVKKAGFEVTICDFRDGIKELPKAKFYGFSATTPHISFAKQLAKEVKGQTIVGGAHPSLLPEDCDGFDYIIKGEGEEILPQILKGWVPKGIILTSRIDDLDSIPFPAWDMVDEPFSKTLYTGERYGEGDVSMAVITSRGCPYSCSFCGNIHRRPVVFRSVENIIGELLELMNRGIYHFRFVDDNFTLHPDFEYLCNKLGGLGIYYRCHTRSNLITQEKVQMLVCSGCEECSVGVEVADDRVLKLNNKKESVAHHKQAVKTIKHFGLKCKTYWMSGLPGETDETIDLNIEFIKEVKPDKWTLSTFTPYPGCDIFNSPDKYGVEIINKDYSNWWNFVFNVRDINLPYREGYVHRLKGQTIEEMKARHHRFYNFLLSEVWK